ncbi:hypothetical protein LTR28_010592, partial [Elasticomyces elasticus]
MPPQPLPHPAQTGFANSSAYDTHRPSFPPTSMQTLLSRLRVAGVARALPLGLKDNCESSWH